MLVLTVPRWRGGVGAHRRHAWYVLSGEECVEYAIGTAAATGLRASLMRRVDAEVVASGMPRRTEIRDECNRGACRNTTKLRRWAVGGGARGGAAGRAQSGDG